MNPTAVKQGQQGAKAAYAPAQQLISAQLPQVANLYTALVQGLQGQVGTQQGNVMTGAQRAGVAAPSMQNQVANMLSAALAPQVAQLGVDKSKAQGAIKGSLGKAQAGRAMAATTLGREVQDAQIAAQQNQMKLQDIDRSAEVARIAEQTRQAQAAARAASRGPGNISMSDLERAMRLTTPRGNSSDPNDKYANPHVLAERYVQWLSNGFSEQDFWSRFQGWWNPNDQSYNDSFYSTVKALGG